jgi:hypothetical protein
MHEIFSRIDYILLDKYSQDNRLNNFVYEYIVHHQQYLLFVDHLLDYYY